MKNLIQIYKFRQEGSKQKFVCPIPASYNDGKRWFRRFETKAEAEDFQEQFSRDPFGTVARLKNIQQGSEPALLKRTDKQQAEFFFSYMLEKLGSLSEGINAINYYFDTYHATKRVSLADAIEQYHVHRATRNLDSRVLADDRSRLSKLVARFGASQLPSITTEDLRQFFADIPLGADGKASNRITYRMKLGPFFTWAHKEAQYLKENPIERISKSDLGEMGVNKEHYEVEQFARMLRIAQGVEPVRPGGECTQEFRDTLFPWFVVSGFAGVRSSEILRDGLDSDALRWSDIYFGAETPHIHIREEIAAKGTGERHIDAPWALAAVRAWLTPNPNFPFVCATERQVREARVRFTELTGITLSENGLRNSFGTYGRAVLGSTDLISGQMGNSPAVAKKYYVRSLPAGRGKAYFELRPQHNIEKAA